MLYASSPLHFLKLTNTNPSRPFAFARLPLSLQLPAPLRSTLLSLLSSSPSSKCLICGVRRWKSDNAFYKSLGKVRNERGLGNATMGTTSSIYLTHRFAPPSLPRQVKNSLGKLACKVVDETVSRMSRDAEEGDYFEDMGDERVVIRVYEVTFVKTGT